METYKRWLFYGLPIFISMGCVTLKTLWDSWLLETVDSLSFQAFALLFPVIVLVNTISVSFANAITGTVAKWTSGDKAKPEVLVFFVVISILLGLVTALIIEFFVASIITWLNAEKYAIQISLFADSLILWLPLQYAMVVFAQLARFLGMFQVSSCIQIASAFIGGVLSYYLVINLNSSAPLQSIIYSNAVMALTSSIALLFLLKGHILSKTKTPDMSIQIVLLKASKLFSTTFASQIMAVIFIFVLTQQISLHGEALIGLMAYLIRAEQLILVLIGAFISVMLPDVIRISNAQDVDGVSSYLKNSDKFLLLVSGIVSFIACSFLIAKILFSEKLYGNGTTVTLITVTFFWLCGTIVQGNIVFYSQILSVVMSPFCAFRLNLIRLMLVGLPFFYLASQLGNGITIAISLLCNSLIFLPVYRKKSMKLAQSVVETSKMNEPVKN